MLVDKYKNQYFHCAVFLLLLSHSVTTGHNQPNLNAQRIKQHKCLSSSSSAMLQYPAKVSLLRNKNVNLPHDKMEALFCKSYFWAPLIRQIVGWLNCSSIFQGILAFRLSVRRTIWAQNCFLFHWYSRWLGKGYKVMSNVNHIVFHSIRQTLAHTNDTEINWCNDKNSCLATVRGENPPLQFQALHLACHVIWSQLSLKKTNPFFPLFYMQV